jgi:hypothetical protein
LRDEKSATSLSCASNEMNKKKQASVSVNRNIRVGVNLFLIRKYHFPIK